MGGEGFTDDVLQVRGRGYSGWGGWREGACCGQRGGQEGWRLGGWTSEVGRAGTGRVGAALTLSSALFEWDRTGPEEFNSRKDSDQLGCFHVFGR